MKALTSKLTGLIGIVLVFLLPNQASAYLYIGDIENTTSSGKVAASCLPPAQATDLDINNVRALIQTGGDMWWDLQGQAQYEVPKPQVIGERGPTAIFAGSLWLGGVDVSNQLKVAAQRFRQVGNDFWTGPLRTDNAETSADVCQQYDKHFKTTKIEVETFVAWNQAKKFDAVEGTSTAEENFPNYSVPLSIQEWPGNYSGPNADNYDFFLAPYVDAGGGIEYNWQDGDYPAYDLTGTGECDTKSLDQIYGDQNLWWVFNDNGNIHTESGSTQAIGMEIKAQAFAFATNDEVNSMTFYNYKLINRSTFTLTDTYFGFWVDPDLGGPQDDYVGCDVSRGLGFCYNGDSYDESASGAQGYLDKPAAIGVDFFQGPFQDFDGEDNLWGTGEGQAVEGNGVGYDDGEVDNERFGMRRFLYHNNSGGPTGDPSSATSYYNFLRGIWNDGSQMVYGGTGHPNGCGAPFSCNPSEFMFPGDSDTENWGTGESEIPWTEESSGNTPGDRRFLQSAGPFTLAPGAANFITAGVVFARANSGGALASVELLKQADNKTQAAFDNCFKILEGPYAPNLTFQELNQEIIGYITNPITSNNYKEQYSQLDPGLPAPEEILVSDSNIVVADTTDINYTYLTDYDTLVAQDSTLITDSVFITMDYSVNPPDSVFYYYSYMGYSNPDTVYSQAGIFPCYGFKSFTDVGYIDSTFLAYDTTFVSHTFTYSLPTDTDTVAIMLTDSFVLAIDSSGMPFDTTYYPYSYTDYNSDSLTDSTIIAVAFIDSSETSWDSIPVSVFYNPILKECVYIDHIDTIVTYEITQGIEEVLNFYSLTEEEKTEYSTYYFQGYKVYQVVNSSVSSADLDDVEKARLAFQCDIKDGINTIINYEFDETTQQTVPKLKVEGEDQGIAHSFRLREDLFAEGDNKLVNHKEYYFMAVAYAYNYSEYNVYDPANTAAGGQKLPYLESGKSASGSSVQVFTAIPHKTDVENNGTIINSSYGDEVALTRIEGKGNGGRFLRLTEGSVDEIMDGEPWGAATLTYEEGFAPISVKVIDPLNVPSGDFTFRLLEVDSTKNVLFTGATWELDFVGQINGRDTSISWTSDISIEVGNEQLLLEVGLSLYIEQVPFITNGSVSEDDLAYTDAFLGAEIEFEDENNRWLEGIPDDDADSNLNWIRSGKVSVDDNAFLEDYYTLSNSENKWVDPLEVYEDILGGTWAPYKLTAAEANGPLATSANDFRYRSNTHVVHNRLRFLNNVDVVLTPDKSKWTRCVVLEMQRDVTVVENGTRKGFPRRALSVDKNGNPMDTTGLGLSLDNLPSSNNPDDPNFIGAYGMSWFPGYAIDVETGERLNMAFGEDSWLGSENGNDMIWNPTSSITEGPFNDIRLAGKHFIFVFRNNVVEDSYNNFLGTILNGTVLYSLKEDFQVPAYDYGKHIFENLTTPGIGYSDREFKDVHKAITWTGFPKLSETAELLSMEEGLIPSKVTVRLRVSKPYQTYVYPETTYGVDEELPESQQYYVLRGPISYEGTTYSHGDYFDGEAGNTFSIPSMSAIINLRDSNNNVVPAQNYGRPYYTFNTDKYAAIRNDLATAEDALQLINVVPNPYYAYSEYEVDRLDNRIKIINLPEECTVSIYTSNGILVRQLTKDDPSVTSLQWNLKNNANITVSSGIYLIHVEAPGIGERIVKWFGMMRPIDLDSF